MAEIRDFDALADWISDYLTGRIRMSIYPLLPKDGGGVMGGPVAVDVDLPEVTDMASVMDRAENEAILVEAGEPASPTPVFPERYLALPFDGGNIFIGEPEFDHASVVRDMPPTQLLIYMAGGVLIALQENPEAGES